MHFSEYQKLAMASKSKDLLGDAQIVNAVMGLNGEAGEVIDILKKHIFQGHDIDKEHLAKECGDVLWYVAVLAKGLGYELDEIAEINKAKLRKRYPDGFEVEKSLHRAEGDI